MNLMTKEKQEKNREGEAVVINNPDVVIEERIEKEKPLILQLALPISIIIAALIISGTVFFTRNSGNKVSESGAAKVKIDLGKNDQVIGSEKAKVIIYEFSDFQCPFCRRFWADSYAQIKRDYIDTGKVKLVFKHYPLPFHSAASVSAEAVECAAEQGKFWELHDKIFSEQIKKGEGTIQYTEADIKKWAKEISLNTESLSNCLASKKYQAKVAKDLELGNKLGVSGTPTFFVDGKQIVGALPYESFKSSIDEALNSGFKFKFW